MTYDIAMEDTPHNFLANGIVVHNSGRFMGVAPATMAFIGIEQETLSGRICRLLYPQHDIRVAPIQRTQLDPESVDAVVGNVPFAQEKTAYWGRKLSLHEVCIAKSVDALRPGGVLALVVTHSLLDRQQAIFRTLLAQHATFLGAIRLPSDAFAAEGTRVVADLLFLKKDTGGNVRRWMDSAPWEHQGVTAAINHYFHAHQDMLLGTITHQDRL
jgi:type I restriction-modification system DNA methylase subunit